MKVSDWRFPSGYERENMRKRTIYWWLRIKARNYNTDGKFIRFLNYRRGYFICPLITSFNESRSTNLCLARMFSPTRVTRWTINFLSLLYLFASLDVIHNYPAIEWHCRGLLVLSKLNYNERECFVINEERKVTDTETLFCWKGDIEGRSSGWNLFGQPMDKSDAF